MAIETFDQALEFLDALVPTGNKPYEKPSLARMERFLELLGNPHRAYPTIHTGGTAGKTSTSYFAAAILEKAGYKTGLHISPHLEDVRERAQINQHLMPEITLITLINHITPIMHQVEQEGQGKVSYFEALLAIAFLYFQQEKVDIAVIEVGLGGTFDGTNVITPEVAVLTNVGLDHTEILGDTIEKIAQDKAGIFKKGVPVITGVTQPSIIKIVEDKVKLLGSAVSRLHNEITYEIKEQTVEGTVFTLHLPNKSYLDLKLKALGKHQVQNASLAIAAVSCLDNKRFLISDNAICQALAETTIPGRFEQIQLQATSYKLQVILDGAHNQVKIEVLVNLLKQLYPRKRFRFIFAVKKDKDRTTMIETLSEIAEKFYFTQFNRVLDMGRSLSVDPGELADLTPQPSEIFETAQSALETALAESRNSDMICVTGSLYLVGQVRTILSQYQE